MFPSWPRVALAAAALLLSCAGTAGAQECVTCWNASCPGLKSYVKACSEPSKRKSKGTSPSQKAAEPAPQQVPTQPAVPGPEACTGGKVSVAGHCCLPGQDWGASSGKCIGTPQCPAGMSVDAQNGCSCEAGRTLVSGHCCWPGQDWGVTSNRCVGPPTCPAGLSPSANEGCEESFPSEVVGTPITPENIDQFVRAAIPTVGDSTLQTVRSNVFAPDNHTTNVTNEVVHMMVVLRTLDGKSWGARYRLSAAGYPILPLERFKTALQANGVSADAQDAWARAIAKELAAKGTVNALCVFNNGNANSIRVRVNKDELNYLETVDTGFLRAGTYREADYGPAVHDAESFSRTGFDSGDAKRLPLVKIP